VVVAEDDDVIHASIPPPADLQLALLIPEFSMPTEESRQKLPERLTRNQAVHNIGRAALLVAALTQGRYDLLNAATEDVLHQPARATIFTAMYPIFQAARSAGALGVFLSGGGPTIAAFVQGRGEDVAGAMREAAAVHGVEATTRVCALRTQGAEILERE
jgi:homoserine kinase